MTLTKIEETIYPPIHTLFLPFLNYLVFSEKMLQVYRYSTGDCIRS